MTRRPKLILWLAAIACLAWLLWFCCFRKSFHTESMTLSYVSFGPPASILVVVRDQDGAPVTGVSVAIENTSGTQGEITDGAGQAIIRPGESEVLGIWIDGDEVRLRHTILFDDLFAPGCFGDGLTFFARMSKSNHTQQAASGNGAQAR
jgi:hypothetical protein